jgi:RimJ/RimL family protein N-acetyltransferase/GNAT superfamily N-acetyltransferase
MTFTLLRTDRLLLRPVRATDAAALAARRSDPEVAKYQAWIPPYPIDQAEAMIAELMAMDGPVDDDWWTLTIADKSDTTVFGDLVVKLSWQGRTAEVGYNLDRSAWGHGYAVEAVEALVEYLFDTMGVTRIEGMLHPDNLASAMVLERVGMRFEGHTRSSFWVGDDNSDDWLYGMIRSDWIAWRGRPRHRPETVELVEITTDNLRTTMRLGTHKSQERFVAPVLQSLGEALVPPVENGVTLDPWYRTVYADAEPVGFVMLARSQPRAEEPWLWRLLVDRMHQRRGIGSRVIELVTEQCRAWGDATLLTSWRPGRGSPEPMYLARGFVPTGEIDDGEVVARLRLTCEA